MSTRSHEKTIIQFKICSEEASSLKKVSVVSSCMACYSGCYMVVIYNVFFYDWYMENPHQKLSAMICSKASTAHSVDPQSTLNAKTILSVSRSSCAGERTQVVDQSSESCRRVSPHEIKWFVLGSEAFDYLLSDPLAHSFNVAWFVPAPLL